MRLRFVLLIVVGSLAIACGIGNESTGDEKLPFVDLPGTPVNFDEIRVNPAPQTPLTWYSGYDSAQRLVIRSPVEWEAAWATIFATHTPKPSLPDVDFAREMVVVAAAGIHGSSGYGVVVRNAALDGATLYLGVVETQPGADCVLAAVQTSPVYAVRIARFDGDPVFVNDSVDIACGP